MASDIICEDWVTVIGTMLAGATNGKPYRISTAYVEFENNGGGSVSLPATPGTSGAAAYYAGLSGGSSHRDYLRIPLVSALFDGSAKKLQFMAQITDGTGRSGALPFSSTQSSRIYGGALVVTPVYADPSQDLIIARFYFDAADQVIKLADTQISLTREISFA